MYSTPGNSTFYQPCLHHIILFHTLLMQDNLLYSSLLFSTQHCSFLLYSTLHYFFLLVSSRDRFLLHFSTLNYYITYYSTCRSVSTSVGIFFHIQLHSEKETCYATNRLFLASFLNRLQFTSESYFLNRVHCWFLISPILFVLHFLCDGDVF